jgi:hypothetical protein
MCLIKHHTMKIWRSVGTAPCILNIGTKRKVTGQLRVMTTLLPTPPPPPVPI